MLLERAMASGCLTTSTRVRMPNSSHVSSSALISSCHPCPRSGCKLLRFPSHSLGTDMCSYSTKSFLGNTCQAAESPHTKQIEASWPDVEGRVTTIIKISSTAETHPQSALYMIWQFGRYDGRGQRSSFTAPGQVPKCCPVVNSQMM